MHNKVLLRIVASLLPQSKALGVLQDRRENLEVDNGVRSAIDFHRNNCKAASLCKTSLPSQFLHHTEHFGSIAKVRLKGAEDRGP